MGKLSVRQVTERAGVSLNLVYGWVRDRRLPHYRVGTTGKRGRILIDEADLDAFLESLKVGSAPQRPTGSGAVRATASRPVPTVVLKHVRVTPSSARPGGSPRCGPSANTPGPA